MDRVTQYMQTILENFVLWRVKCRKLTFFCVRFWNGMQYLKKGVGEWGKTQGARGKEIALSLVSFNESDTLQSGQSLPGQNLLARDIRKCWHAWHKFVQYPLGWSLRNVRSRFEPANKEAILSNDKKICQSSLYWYFYKLFWQWTFWEWITKVIR